MKVLQTCQVHRTRRNFQLLNDITTYHARLFGSHGVSGKQGYKDLIKIFSI